MKNYLKETNTVIANSGIKGTRICFEQALWNSSDGSMKSYYHVHVQHDDLPDLNIGIGDSSFENLMTKIENIIIPEIKQKLGLISI